MTDVAGKFCQTMATTATNTNKQHIATGLTNYTENLASYNSITLN